MTESLVAAQEGLSIGVAPAERGLGNYKPLVRLYREHSKITPARPLGEYL